MIALDTHILVWGVQGQQCPTNPGIVGRTQHYLGHLQREKTRVILPAPVVTEYLQGFSPDEQEQQWQALQRFVVVAFDLPAARLAAAISANQAAQALRQSKPTNCLGQTVGSQSLRVDIIILATAITAGATEFITHDSHYHNLAQVSPQKIAIREVPTIPIQEELFPFQ